VVVVPSGHVVEREDVLADAVSRAVDCVRGEKESLVLLGIRPGSAEPGYGWITPSQALADDLYAVVSFVEKPQRERAMELIRRGGLWNSFIFVARGSALMGLFEWTLPWLTRMFTHVQVSAGRRRDAVLPHLYERLPDIDFSREVLQGLKEELRVLVVPPCGWTDLGTETPVPAEAEAVDHCPISEGTGLSTTDA
jgi:mannose-1-phosphate guanylyltransferase